MRIGITYNAGGSIFNGSEGQTAIFLSILCNKLQYSVTFLNTGDPDKKWWNDFVPDNETTSHILDISMQQFDLLIDIDGAVAPDIRTKISTKSVVFMRGFLEFSELDKTAYFIETKLRRLKNIEEVWVWDILNPEETLEPIQVLFPCPIKRVPFIWSPHILEVYMNSKNLQVNSPVHSEPISLAITEKNKENTSSCILPIVAIRDIYNKDLLKKENKVYVFNTEKLKNNKFFMENILNNIEHSNYPIEFKDHVPYAELTNKNTIVFSHIRFIPFRPGLIDLIWLGIPVLHNSVLLRDMGVDALYYNNNSILEMETALKRFLENPETSWFSRVNDWRNTITSIWSIETHLDTWKKVFSSAQAPSCSKGVLQNPTASERPCLEEVQSTSVIRIGFCDIWDGFNVTNNFFTQILQEELSKNGLNIKIRGENASSQSDAIIFGPFGNVWETFKNTDNPKIFFSAENLIKPQSSAIQLYLTPFHATHDKMIRLPTWYTFIDWFSKSTELPSPDSSDNPILMPVHFAKTTHPVKISDRKEFCAFVVSNPTCQFRNSTFNVVNNYKHVNSGGALYNNIGGQLSLKYPGGGCGDISKYHFLSEHKFNICFENSQAQGYITEKLLHAKMAGCIPLYWGDRNTLSDFAPDSHLNFSEINDPNIVLETIKELEKDPALCDTIGSKPLLDEASLNRAYNTISEIAKRILTLTRKLPVNSTPSAINLSQASTSEKTQSKQLTETNSPIFVSYSTKLFLQSALRNVKAVEQFRALDNSIRYILYLGDDITPDTIKEIESVSNWLEIRRLPTHDTPPDFPDYWEGKHYGWKLYILNAVCNELKSNNSTVFYIDSGIICTRLPIDFFNAAKEHGICFLSDAEQINRHWCSDKMIELMKVTEDELKQNQILAGLVAFNPSHTLAQTVLASAYELSKKRDILVGLKWAGVDHTGHPYGHRHDQSILSILKIRHKVPTIIAQELINSTSLRKAYLENKCLYIHRGDFKVNEQPINKVDDVVVINLAKRTDRFEQWYKSDPLFTKAAQRFSAIDGTTLKLTESIWRLFEHNDHKWKKSVMGCAMSHIGVWLQLLADNVNSYLVLEDDMRFTYSNWRDIWENASEMIPNDAELLYLGGVLPNNRQILPKVLNNVNDYWAKIKPNTIFGSSTPLPIFHFCAYSYIITKSGAQKLINWLLNTNEKCFTSIDHFLGHPLIGLNKYVMTPQIVGCFQDNDPRYVESEFDNFDRVDSFDSDIWNNKELFTKEELINYSSMPKGNFKSVWISVWGAISKTDKVDMCTQKLLSPHYYTQYLQRSNNLEELHAINEYLYTDINKDEIAKEECPNGKALKTFNERDLIWSYHGANCSIETLRDYRPHEYKLTEKPSADYLDILYNTKFCPVISDGNTEIAQLITILDCGAIPVYVRATSDENIWNSISTNLCLLEIESWDKAKHVMQYLCDNPNIAEEYRSGLVNKWNEWKMVLET